MTPQPDRALNQPQADDRQLAGGTGHDNIELGQPLRHILQPDGQGAIPLGHLTAAVDGAVGNDDLPRFLCREMRGAKPDHLAGTDEQDALFGDIPENAFRQMYRRSGHGHDVGADGRGRTHVLGHGKRLLE